MPLYDIAFPPGAKFASPGPIAPVTSIGLDGDQHPLAFDLGDPGGTDAFFQLGQKTDLAMAATAADRVGQPGVCENGMMGSGGGGLGEQRGGGALRHAGGGGVESESTRIPRQH